ncbi:ATP-binding protein [Candidatus Poriferisocius sp.]|uniref:ATP-binding protein n=1 Tax=Candidatus Poriferisocius sp. TaxID=3101276 RepID=UPI003B022467
MAEFRRAQVATLIERLAEQPNVLIAIFGPRQSGKTTAVRQALASIDQESWYVSIEPQMEALERSPPGESLPSSTGQTESVTSEAPQADERQLIEAWEHCRQQAEHSPAGFVLVLDEVQRIDRWSSLVKKLWDEDRWNGCPLHVVLLGSAPLLMQAGLTESLAGRFEPIRFTHWSYSEMSAAFDLSLDEYIYFGGYPGAAARIAETNRWCDYVRSAFIGPNIERDVLSMVRVDKPELLKRLFELGARYSGQEVSYTKLMGHLQEAGNTTTLTRYLDLLSRVGMLAGLPKHANRLTSAKSPTPKLNVFNTALMSAVCGLSFDEAQADRTYWGRLVESSVGAHLLNAASTRTEVKYWRDQNFEVDFVLERGSNLVGIEVKSGQAFAETRGLTEFQRRFQPKNAIVVGDAGVPLHEFLSVPPDHWFDST